jgi:hypothetical protein
LQALKDAESFEPLGTCGTEEEIGTVEILVNFIGQFHEQHGFGTWCEGEDFIGYVVR